MPRAGRCTSRNRSLHRYYHPSTGAHFYTTNWNELGAGNFGWVHEGIACHVYPNALAGATPLSLLERHCRRPLLHDQLGRAGKRAFRLGLRGHPMLGVRSGRRRRPRCTRAGARGGSAASTTTIFHASRTGLGAIGSGGSGGSRQGCVRADLGGHRARDGAHRALTAAVRRQERRGRRARCVRPDGRASAVEYAESGLACAAFRWSASARTSDRAPLTGQPLPPFTVERK